MHEAILAGLKRLQPCESMIPENSHTAFSVVKSGQHWSLCFTLAISGQQGNVNIVHSRASVRQEPHLPVERHVLALYGSQNLCLLAPDSAVTQALVDSQFLAQ